MGVWGVRALVLVLVLALLFTMVNVQTFAAAGHAVGSVQWWIAWLLDPMASITMGTAIVFEGLLAGYGRTVGWLTATKWYAGLGTWAMNIWVSMAGGSLAGVVLHSVAPGLVLLLAEAAPRVRRHLAEILSSLPDHDSGLSARPVGLPVSDHAPVGPPAAVSRRVAPVPAWAPPRPPQQPADQAIDVEPVGAPGAPPVPDLVAPAGPQPAPWMAPDPVGEPAPSLVPGSECSRGEGDLVTRVRRVIRDSAAAGARAPGRRAIAKQLGASEHQVRVALELVGARTGPALTASSSSSGHAGHRSENR